MDWSNKQERAAFLQAFTVLGEVFGKECSDALIRIYFEALQSFDAQEVVSAIHRAVKECRFFPKPVELAEMIGPGKIEDRAEVEAGKVLKAIGSVGGWSSVTFDDPTTMAVIEIAFGGWSKLCSDLNTDKEVWFLKDFARTYQAYSRQGIKRFGHLAGLQEKQNAGHYMGHIPRPVLIGDRQKAAAIAADNKRPMLGRGEGPQEAGQSVARLLDRARSAAVGNA